MNAADSRILPKYVIELRDHLVLSSYETPWISQYVSHRRVVPPRHEVEIPIVLFKECPTPQAGT